MCDCASFSQSWSFNRSKISRNGKFYKSLNSASISDGFPKKTQYTVCELFTHQGLNGWALCTCTRANASRAATPRRCHRVELPLLLLLLVVLHCSCCSCYCCTLNHCPRTLLSGAARPLPTRGWWASGVWEGVVIKWSPASAPSSLRWDALGQKHAGDFSSNPWPSGNKDSLWVLQPSVILATVQCSAFGVVNPIT